MRLGERLWRDGFRYSTCGVMISELLPETVGNRRCRLSWIGAPGASVEGGGSAQCLARRGTIRILSADAKNAVWKLRAEHRSPRWTTRWDELPRIKSGSVHMGGNADPQGSEGR